MGFDNRKTGLQRVGVCKPDYDSGLLYIVQTQRKISIKFEEHFWDIIRDAHQCDYSVKILC